jgi:hypothetical protein
MTARIKKQPIKCELESEIAATALPYPTAPDTPSTRITCRGKTNSELQMPSSEELDIKAAALIAQSQLFILT